MTYGYVWNLPRDKGDMILKQTFKIFNKSKHYYFYVTP